MLPADAHQWVVAVAGHPDKDIGCLDVPVHNWHGAGMEVLQSKQDLPGNMAAWKKTKVKVILL